MEELYGSNISSWKSASVSWDCIDTETTKCSIETALLIHQIFTEHCGKDWEVSSEQNSDKSLCPYEERQTINKQINKSVWLQKYYEYKKRKKG